MYKVDKKTIGKNLRALRGDMTQKEVGEKVNVSATAWDNYEQGKRIPRDETKVKIALLFGLSIEDIFYNAKNTHELWTSLLEFKHC